MRHKRTGPHAKISIWLDDLPLVYDVFNFDRRKERRELANAAQNKLGDLDRQSCAQVRMQAMVDSFCGGLWSAWLQSTRGEMMGGAEIAPLEMIADNLIQRGGVSLLYRLRAAQSRGRRWRSIRASSMG